MDNNQQEQNDEESSEAINVASSPQTFDDLSKNASLEVMEVLGDFYVSSVNEMHTEEVQTVQALKSNEGFNVSVEANDEDAVNDVSRTRVISEVLSDKESDKDNRTETFWPSTVQDVEDSGFKKEGIHKTRDDPIVSFDIDFSSASTAKLHTSIV